MIPGDAKVIQVHTDMRQIGFNLRTDIGVVGGAGPVAAQLLEAVQGKLEKPVDVSWLGPPTKRDASTLPEPYQAKEVPVHPGRCAGEVARFMEKEGRDWTLICDGGEASVWMGLAIGGFVIFFKWAAQSRTVLLMLPFIAGTFLLVKEWCLRSYLRRKVLTEDGPSVLMGRYRSSSIFA